MNILNDKDRQEIIKKIQMAKNHHPFFCRQFLKISNKDGEQIPFGLNEIQLDFVNKLNKWNGKYKKIIVLKGRQFGMSTLIESIFFRKTIFNKDKKTLVIAHKQDSTNTLFEMTKYFYNNLPDFLKMVFPLEKSNAKELVFKDTNSSFKITTAGSPDKARSQKNNYLHCSEVAFWEQPDKLIPALEETVGKGTGNIMILESTANGYNYFRDEFEKGLTDDIESPVKSIFYGWDRHSEYTIPINSEIYKTRKEFTETYTPEEIELAKTFKLTCEQINWRRYKIKLTYAGREQLFKQEYPLCWQEAFLSPAVGITPLIEIEKIIQARKNNLNPSEFAPVIVGVDPARQGNDRTVITIRKGRKILTIYTLKDKTAPEIEGFIIHTIINSTFNPDAIFIDAGYGLDIVDHIRELGYKKVKAIFFNAKPTDENRYVNKRSEMHDQVRNWFYQEGGVDIKDNDEICNEYSIIPDLKINSQGRLYMPPKEEIKELNLNKSPDYFDSLALTFAEPVNTRPRYSEEAQTNIIWK